MPSIKSDESGGNRRPENMANTPGENTPPRLGSAGGKIGRPRKVGRPKGSTSLNNLAGLGLPSTNIGSKSSLSLSNASLTGNLSLDVANSFSSGLGSFETGTQRRKPFSSRRGEGETTGYSSGSTTPSRSNSRSTSNLSNAPLASMQLGGTIVREDGTFPEFEDPVSVHEARYPLPPLSEAHFKGTTDFAKKPFPNLAPSVQGLCYPPSAASITEAQTRARQILSQLRNCVAADQKAVYDPDYRTPFSSFDDALTRLLPYHIYQYWDELLLPHEEIRSKQISSKAEQLDAMIPQIRQRYSDILKKHNVGLAPHFTAGNTKHEGWLLRQVVDDLQQQVVQLQATRDSLINQGQLPAANTSLTFPKSFS